MQRFAAGRLASPEEGTVSVLDLVTPEGMVAKLSAASKTEALAMLACAAAARRGIDGDALLDALANRERLSSTGIGGGIAMPRAQIDGVSAVQGLLARFQPPIDFEAIDELPVDLAFLALLPTDGGAEVLRALEGMARAVRNPGLVRALRTARDAAGMHAALAEWERADTHRYEQGRTRNHAR